jgi:uncharacterized membrane protein (UPF0127 family)
MRNAVLAMLVLGALLAGSTWARDAALSSPAGPVVPSCVNPALPPELLDGSVQAPAKPLSVVVATGSGVTLRLAVANDEPTREKGLMCVLKLKPQHGMIFVFDRASDWEFWMKDTLAPLDMVWVGDDGTIANVAANVPASTLATSDDAVARRRGHGRFVIELAAGEAQTDGLKPGGRLKLPPLSTASHY